MTKDIERCGAKSGDKLCVLNKGHKRSHFFREVPELGGSSLFKGGPLLDCFCPYCGSRTV